MTKQEIKDDRVLVSYAVYYDEWKSLWDSGLSQPKAWQEVENRYRAFFGQSKYTSFDSFRQVVRNKTQ